MSEFIAIDFETANERVGSPCAVGWAISADGTITDRGSLLIRPPEFRFAGFNVSLHGITAEMCESAPPWRDALEVIVETIGTRLVAAHYAPFDMGVIRHACDETGIARPELSFTCTCRLARVIWPGEACYSLPDVVDMIGLEPFEHHDASDDAWACAAIAQAAVRTRGELGLAELLAELALPPGRLSPGSYLPAGRAAHHMPTEPRPGVHADPDHPFFGKKIAFTGGLTSMPRHEAQQAVVDAGGKATTSISRFTDYLVVGGEFHGLLRGHQSHRLETALELRSHGAKVELLNEADFLSTLRGGA